MTVQLLPGETRDGRWNWRWSEPKNARAQRRVKLKRCQLQALGRRCEVLLRTNALSPIAIKQISANIPAANRKKKIFCILPQRDDTSGRFVYKQTRRWRNKAEKENDSRMHNELSRVENLSIDLTLNFIWQKTFVELNINIREKAEYMQIAGSLRS